MWMFKQACVDLLNIIFWGQTLSSFWLI